MFFYHILRICKISHTFSTFRHATLNSYFSTQLFVMSIKNELSVWIAHFQFKPKLIFWLIDRAYPIYHWRCIQLKKYFLGGEGVITDIPLHVLLKEKLLYCSLSYINAPPLPFFFILVSMVKNCVFFRPGVVAAAEQ